MVETVDPVRLRSLTVDGGASSDPIEFRPTRVVVAGYTGRDRARVQAHIDELAAIGVAPPDRVPSYYEQPLEMLTFHGAITVPSSSTSGEAEPVLLFTEAGPMLAVGSDHTDREQERIDVGTSKAVCPKVVSRQVVPLAEVGDTWDDGVLRSWADGEPYQEHPLAAITPPPDLVADFTTVFGDPTPGLVLFLGTVPLIGGTFSFAHSYRMTLTTSDRREIALTYDVQEA